MDAAKMPTLTFQDGYGGSQDLGKVSDQSKDTQVVNQEKEAHWGKKTKSLTDYGLETIFHAIILKSPLRRHLYVSLGIQKA